MTRRKTARTILLVLAFLATPMILHANAGIPMIAFSYPLLLLLLFGVIAIETEYLHRTLHTEWNKTMSATTLANIITTVLGYPVVWIIYFVLQMLLWSAVNSLGIVQFVQNHHLSNTLAVEILTTIMTAAWLFTGESSWTVILAFAVLLIPMFFLSGFIEARIITKRLASDPKDPSVMHGVWRANLISYIFLLAAGAVTISLFAR